MKVSTSRSGWPFALSLAMAVLCGGADTMRVRDVLPVEGGEVWAATDGGLLRFDAAGALLQKYTTADGLPCDRLRELAAAHDGALWIATLGGLSRFDGEGFENYTTEQGLGEDAVHTVEFDREGRLFAGTERGAVLFDGSRFTRFYDTHEFSLRPTYAIHAAGDGSLWFAKENALTHLSAGDQWRVFQRDALLTGPRARMISNSVRAVATDDLHHVWIATHEGVGLFDETGWRRLTTREGLAHDRAVTLAFDEEGYLWIGYGDSKDYAGGAGASRFKDGAWLHMTVEDGLPDNRVYRIRIGDDGAVWFATAAGAARYREGEFTWFVDRREQR